MDNNNHVVIMAGGIGSRFWPMSTVEKPKQFIDILGTGKTLIQHTAERFSDVCPPENIWVVTSKNYLDLVKQQLSQIPESNILLEPCMRNTAPCIAYVAWKIKKRFPQANLVISAADHIVLNTKEFSRVIQKGLDFTAKSDNILTLGIKPSRPETGYGYIKLKEGTEKDEIFEVEGFKEKPDVETAKQYVAEGDYTWNSGIFIWNIQTIEQSFRTYEPEMSELFDSLEDVFYTRAEQECIDKKFPDCKNISIDYAIMERANNIYVFPVDFGWSDLGTWGSLHELSAKDTQDNAVLSKHVKMIDSQGCIVNVSDDKKMVIEGLENYIIAERNNVFLICKKENEQHIKEFSKLIEP